MQMKIFIDKDELYPFFRINEKIDSYCEREVEVSQDTLDNWNATWSLFWQMQKELQVLYKLREQDVKLSPRTPEIARSRHRPL